jgi:hypothetical protein
MTVHRGEEQLILGLASGVTVEQAARAAGMSVRTAFRRLERPEFRSRVTRARTDLLERGLGRLAAASASAAAVLERQLEAESAAVQVRAAISILGLGGRLHEQLDLAERLEAIEDALNWQADAEAAPAAH